MTDYLGAISTQMDLPTVHIILQLIGVLGSIAYVGGFFLVQSGKLCGNGLVYPFSNLFAAICVSLSLMTAFNLASLLIQISFIAIASYGIWYRISGRIVAGRDRSGATVMLVPARVERPGAAEATATLSAAFGASVTRQPEHTARRNVA